MQLDELERRLRALTDNRATNALFIFVLLVVVVSAILVFGALAFYTLPWSAILLTLFGGLYYVCYLAEPYLRKWLGL